MLWTYPTIRCTPHRRHGRPVERAQLPTAAELEGRDEPGIGFGAGTEPLRAVCNLPKQRLERRNDNRQSGGIVEPFAVIDMGAAQRRNGKCAAAQPKWALEVRRISV